MTSIVSSNNKTFRFRSSEATVQGGVGALFLVSAGLTWAVATGRIHNPDFAYWSGWVIAVGVVFVMLWRQHRAVQLAAIQSGLIEVNDQSLRWTRGDGTVVLDVPSTQLTRGLVDRTAHTFVLFGQDDAAVLFLNEGGYVVVHGFEELLDALRVYCPITDYEPPKGLAFAKPVVAWGLLFLGSGALLHAVNHALFRTAGWRVFPLVPWALAALGALYLVVGVQFYRGRGPMVSQLYNREFIHRLWKPLLLLVVLNFVLVGLGVVSR